MKYLVGTVILAVINLYVDYRIFSRCVTLKQYPVITAVMFLIFFIIQMISFVGKFDLLLYLEQKTNFDLTLITYQISYLAFGVLSCLFFYIVVIDIIDIVLRLLSLRSFAVYYYFTQFALPSVILLTLGTVALGVLQTVRGPRVETVEVFIENLPISFDKFRIVQISDLHVGQTIKYDYVNKAVAIANSLKPNIIALTGDMIDGRVARLRHDVSPLSNLESSHGTFFVTGNHEYYSGAQEWIEEFTNIGIRCLSNEHTLITQNEDQIVLAGVTDYSTIRMGLSNPSSPSKAIAGAPLGLIKILLAHQPSSYIEAHKAGFNLQLSGHTHAGQYFPYTMLIKLFHRYYKGLNKHDNTWIYINRGTGYWGPPFRLGSPAEISLIILRST